MRFRKLISCATSTTTSRIQIVYTTHSPFMVPTHAIERVRTANIAQDAGTTVSNDPTGDARTLFPLQSALGYSISQSLFIGANNLVLEGVTDYWILSSIKDFIADRGQGTCLDKRFTLTPAGGAQRVSYMVALLTSERLQVVVLFDDERQSRATSVELLKAKLVRDEGIAWVTEAFDDPKPPKPTSKISWTRMSSMLSFAKHTQKSSRAKRCR